MKQQKQRLVLVISSDHYNELTEDIVVLAITSKLKDLEYSVMIDSKYLTEDTLKITSEIRADKVYTLSKNIVRKRFGQVNTEILEDVRVKINELIK